MILTSFQRLFRLVFTKFNPEQPHIRKKKSSPQAPAAGALPTGVFWWLLLMFLRVNVHSDHSPTTDWCHCYMMRLRSPTTHRRSDAGNSFVHTLDISWGAGLSLKLQRSSTLTDRCHLATDANARCAIHKRNMIRVSRSWSGDYCWSERKSPECLQLSLN